MPARSAPRYGETVTLPRLDGILSTLRVVSLPLARRFRGIEVREAALLEGEAGWGEFAPFTEYDDDEAATWLASALGDSGRERPAAVRDVVHVNATVPAVDAADVSAVLARFDGCRTAKVKVAERGQSLADDVARVAAVRRTMGPDARVRVDANGGWTLAEADTALRALTPFDLEYAEQPVAEVKDLARLRAEGIGIPLAADESVRKAEDPLQVARAGAADLLVVKAAPLGGIRAALDIVAQAGLPVVVSSALDTSVGLSTGIGLAAALPTLSYDCGLGTASLLAADVVRESLRPVDGVVPVGRVRPLSTLLDEYAADAERTAWWRERVVRCYRVLEERDALATDR